MARRSKNPTNTAPVAIEERERAIDAAVSSIERMFGKGAIMRFGDEEVPKVSTIPTGSINLDLGLGVGGVPRGRVIEIFGKESSGKTTLALHIIAESQKLGGVAAFIDAEHALDPNYARNLGVKVNELLISQPDFGEQALEIAETLVRSGAVSVVVVDSVAALVPKAELEGEMGDSLPGLQARLMSQALRKLTGIVNRTGAIVIFVNQVRQKIGVQFGNGEVTTGGNALKFYASVRVDIRRIGALKTGTDVIGNKTRIRVVKNKLAPPFRTVETEIRYGEGICPVADLLVQADERGILDKNGSWYSFEDERLGNGRDAARSRLVEDVALRETLRARVLADAGVGLPEVAVAK